MITRIGFDPSKNSVQEDLRIISKTNTRYMDKNTSVLGARNSFFPKYIICKFANVPGLVDLSRIWQMSMAGTFVPHW